MTIDFSSPMTWLIAGGIILFLWANVKGLRATFDKDDNYVPDILDQKFTVIDTTNDAHITVIKKALDVRQWLADSKNEVAVKAFDESVWPALSKQGG